MPIHFFQYLFDRGYASPNSSDLIEDALVIPCREGQWEYPAFSDGAPTLVFLLSGSACAEFEEQSLSPSAPRSRKISIPSAWCSSQYLERVRIRYSDDSHIQALPGSGAGEHPDSGSLLVVRLNPILFPGMIRLSMPELRSQYAWDLPTLFGNSASQLLEVVKQMPSAKEKIHAIRQWVDTLVLREDFISNSLLSLALAHIRAARGCLSIDALAASLRVNYKWLERNFLQHTGLTPKEYARLQRFIHAWRELVETEGRDLMGTAITAGYHDQNHFTKDFKRFTGLAPLRYLQAQR